MATLTRNTFTAGSAIVAADMNSNFTNVEALINDVLDGTQSHGAFQATGTVTISGAMTCEDLTVNGTLNATVSGSVDSLKGEILADNNDIVLQNGTTGSGSTYRGTILASDNTTTVLANGTNGTDATFKGDVVNSSGTVIVDVSAASFNGDITGNAATATSATSATTAGYATSAGSVTTATNATNVSTGSTSDTTAYLALLNNAGGTQQIKYDSSVYVNASTNEVTASTFRANSGSLSAPSFVVEDTDTGLCSLGANTFAASCGGSGITAWTTTNFKPFGNGTIDLGISGNPWKAVYASNGTIQGSDDRLKVMIDDALGLDFVNDLTPFSGVWAQPGYDPCQYEWLSAQNVRAALTAHGRPHDVGIWKVQTEDPETGEPIADGMQSISYGNLIPVLVKAIQELSARVVALEAA